MREQSTQGQNMQLIIMRHGQTDFNIDHRYAGVLDVPLNDEGRAQAKRAGCAPNVTRVYTSRLERAKETARICFPNALLIERPALAEMDFGDFQGRTPNEMENDADYRAWVDSWCTDPCPHGDSRDAYAQRVAMAVRDIVLEQREQGSKRAVIVGHGGTIMAAFFTFTCKDEALDYYRWNPGNCCGYCADIVFRDSRTALEPPHANDRDNPLKADCPSDLESCNSFDDPVEPEGTRWPFELRNVRKFDDVRFIAREGYA